MLTQDGSARTFPPPERALQTSNLTHCSAQSRVLILELEGEEGPTQESEGLSKSGSALHRPEGKQVDVNEQWEGMVFLEQLWYSPLVPT